MDIHSPEKKLSKNRKLKSKGKNSRAACETYNIPGTQIFNIQNGILIKLEPVFTSDIVSYAYYYSTTIAHKG